MESARAYHLFLLVWVLIFAPPAWGDGSGVLIIGDTERTYFRAFTSSLTASLGRQGVDTTVVNTEQYEGVLPGNGEFKCIVTVGNHAATKLSAKYPPIPVLHALVTESYFLEPDLSRNSQSPRAYLLVDQPVSRLVSLARNSMPERKKLGVIYGPSSNRSRSEVHLQAAGAEFQLIEKEIGEATQLGDAMAAFNGNAELLLTLPDPVVVNEGSAKTLIVGAYLSNLPLIGYSQALVKAGALMSVHSTPEQLGLQGGELIGASFWSDAQRNGVRIYPKYFNVSVNYQVAHALRIKLPSEDDLKARLQKLEAPR